MTSQRDKIHIISRGKKWVVKIESHSHVTRVCLSKSVAIHVAIDIAIQQNYDMVIHNKDGTVSELWSKLSEKKEG